jgi:hypothetical protein
VSREIIVSSEGLVRGSLWITAPLNFAAGFAFAFPASLLGSLIQLPQQSHNLYAMFSGSLIILFGATYFWLALQTTILRPVLFIGACGKSLAVLVTVLLFFSGELSGVTTAFISGDIVFALLWFYWLFQGSSPSDA